LTNSLITVQNNILLLVKKLLLQCNIIVTFWILTNVKTIWTAS